MKCWLKHNWGKWEVIKEGDLVNGRITVGYYWTQCKECSDCGLQKFNTKEVT